MATVETGIQTLVKRLKDTSESEVVRIGAAEGLAYAGGTEALKALQDLIVHYSSSPSEVRSAAAVALGQAIGRMKASGIRDSDSPDERSA